MNGKAETKVRDSALNVKVADFIISMYAYKKPIYVFTVGCIEDVNDTLNDGKTISEVGEWAEFIIMQDGVHNNPYAYLNEKYANAIVDSIRITDTELILFIYD